MAYRVKVAAGTRPAAATIAGRLRRALRRTRFVCDVRLEAEGVVRLDPIRLFEPKDYCGNHPGPCRRGTGRTHRPYRYLEGADWVALNDLVNTVLDRLGAAARVTSTACVVRQGRRRRVCYGRGPRNDWERVGSDGDYEDWCGRRAPASAYPDGTPGYYGTGRAGQRRHWRLSEAPRRRGAGRGPGAGGPRPGRPRRRGLLA